MDQLNYLWGKPQQTGRLKSEFADFIVHEELGYEMSGEGEFVVVKVRKTNANTLYVGEKLAAFVGIHAKNMSYAGLKDRHAVTEQWFCLHLLGKDTPDFSAFQLEGVEILNVTRHHRKIRIGSLMGNHFDILLRDVKETEELQQRLMNLQAVGFPNYFTEQRFGRDGQNLTQALRWANGEIRVKERQKRSFYLSAARSEIFNRLVSERIEDGLITQVLAGDKLQLAGSKSWFIAEQGELEALNKRLESGDILLTAALIGKESGEETERQDEKSSACEREAALIQTYSPLLNLMKEEKVKAARRPMLVKPQDLQWQFCSEGLHLSFFLEAGSYATSLVRELISVQTDTQS